MPSPSDTSSIKLSFSLHASDLTAISRRVNFLRGHQPVVREATLLRAIAHLTPLPALVENTVRFVAAEAVTNPDHGPVTGRPTADFPARDVRKLDAAVTQLASVRIIATRTLVMRANLASAPTGKPLVSYMERFFTEVPFKPRGISKLRLLQAKRRG